jgi:hypothetical protein
MPQNPMLQFGADAGQSRSRTHWMQLPNKHIGALVGQSVARMHWVRQSPKRQLAVWVDVVVQSESIAHCSQRLRTQIGRPVIPAQSALAAHWTHSPLVVLQCGPFPNIVIPVHCASLVQPAWHMKLRGLHSGAETPQSLFERQATQRLSAVRQRGSEAGQSLLIVHWMQA